MYAKVFGSLWNGSLRGERDAQLVFIYLLANCNDVGEVEIIREKIVDDTGVGKERTDDVHEALNVLESSDPLSRSPIEDGRRIVRLSPERNWGWRIVNYDYYRKIRNELERREQNREAQRRWYDRSKQSSSDISNPKPTSAISAQAEVEEEAQESTPSLNGDDRITARQAFLEDFWPRYPRKSGKIAAQRVFLRLVKDDSDELFDEIMHGLSWCKANEWANRERDKIPHAATWLNQRRWEDAKAQT